MNVTHKIKAMTESEALRFVGLFFGSAWLMMHDLQSSLLICLHRYAKHGDAETLRKVHLALHNRHPGIAKRVRDFVHLCVPCSHEVDGKRIPAVAIKKVTTKNDNGSTNIDWSVKCHHTVLEGNKAVVKDGIGSANGQDEAGNNKPTDEQLYVMRRFLAEEQAVGGTANVARMMNCGSDNKGSTAVEKGQHERFMGYVEDATGVPIKAPWVDDGYVGFVYTFGKPHKPKGKKDSELYKDGGTEKKRTMLTERFNKALAALLNCKVGELSESQLEAVGTAVSAIIGEG